jgi:hypothetical protein
MAYASVAELRAELGKTDTGDDATLARLLDAATRNIDDACNRPDGFVADTKATARTYPGSNRGWLRIDECVSVDTVQVKPSSISAYEEWDDSDYLTCAGDERFPDYNPLVKGKPITALRIDPNGDYSVFHRDGTYPTVEVTAKWGYATLVPPTVKTACIMQAVRWYKRLQSGMSDTLAGAEMGILMYTQALDPDIKRLLVDGRYVRKQL